MARPFREFLRVEAAGSILLLVAAAAALIWANVWWDDYYAFWHADISIDIGSFYVGESLQHWVNDGLMAIFFFVVGLEIKQELAVGDLRDPRTAALPIVAALGGMIVPAGLYLAIAGGGPAVHGWGIPMATDIAFAVGVLGLLGRRIPSAARLFLLTLAIVDDIGAILVIAVFYTSDLSFGWLGLAIGIVVLVVGLRRMRVWWIPVYLLLGVLAWYAMLRSGVHATLAGVAFGLLTPATALLKEDVAREYAQEVLADGELGPHELRRLQFLVTESVPVAERLQHFLHPFSAYVVLPVFALANAGVYLGGGGLGEAVTSTVAVAIGVGLVVGKPVGILIACFLAVRLGISRLPRGTTWTQVGGLGAVAGIGFTVSIFIAGLSFPGDPAMTDSAKIGILIASLVAAVLGSAVLAVHDVRRRDRLVGRTTDRAGGGARL